jgi:hypothetical protein
LVSFSVLIKSAGATVDIMRTVFVLLAVDLETVEANVLARPKARGVRGALVAKAWAEIEQRAAVQNIRMICIVESVVGTYR